MRDALDAVTFLVTAVAPQEHQSSDSSWALRMRRAARSAYDCTYDVSRN